MSYHADGEGVDIVDVSDTVLPGDKTLDVDEELIPNAHDGFIVLLISGKRTYSHSWHVISLVLCPL